MTMPASSMNGSSRSSSSSNGSSSITSSQPKKHRQTRIPEHLKAIKKGSSSSSNTLKSNIARALRANSPSKKSESGSTSGSNTPSALQLQTGKSSSNGTSLTSHKMDDVINAQLPVHAPAEQWQQGPASGNAMTTSISSPTRPATSTSHQASFQSINGAPSPSSARLPYALTNDRANELAAAAASAATTTGIERSFSFNGYSQHMQQTRTTSSRPSTATSNAAVLAQDGTPLARSFSSASSMAYSQPEFTFSVPATSSSSQSLLSSTSNSSLSLSSSSQPYLDSLSSSASSSSMPYHQQQQAPSQMSMWSNNNTALPNMGLNMYGQASPTAAMQVSYSNPVKTPTRTKRSGTNLSSVSGSSSSAASSITSSSKRQAFRGISASPAKRSGTSPTTPSTPFSASLILSVSSDGKACLTTPHMGSSSKSPVKTTPKAVAAAAMMRSSTTNAAKTPARPSMMRSITTDPRMSSSMNTSTSSSALKREVSELNGVGRVVGQGKMFDLHGDKDNSGVMSFSTNRQVASLPQSLNLDIEMDLAAGMGGSTHYNNQIAYPYAAFPPQGSILTPPQSAEIAKQTLPLRQNNPKGQPFYPERERFQSSWKFPSGMGLNLHAASGPSSGHLASASSSSSPSSAFQSSFPSMHSLNASITNVAKGGDIPGAGGLASSPALVRSPAQLNSSSSTAHGLASEDMSRRQSRIQAWLDSPDLQDGDETITGSGSGASSWSSLPARHDMDMGSAPPTASSSSTSAGAFSISPASIMSRPTSEINLPSLNTPSIAEEYEEFEVIHASGKSVRPLKMSKKRRLGIDNEDEGDSLSLKDRNAIKAGLGMPFQVSSVNSRQVTPTPDGASPGKRNKLEDSSAQSSPIKNGVQDGKGRKGRKNKKKGSSKCSCGKGSDGGAMIQCDDCRSWFHLACVGVDEEEIPESWFCSPCAAADANAAGDNISSTAAVDYPSPTSPAQAQLGPSLVIQQTPKRPGLTREPTFSKTATPKAESARQFDDAPLLAAPIRPLAIPSTPQSTGAAQYTPGHSHGASLSRAYAPVTPRVGFASTTQTGSASGTNYQWDTYSPHTPSSTIAHGRRLSRQHFTTPSSNWSQLPSSQWEELPSSLPRRSDESERTKQWEQFYNAPPPASINPIPMTPPLASHSAFAASESFLPPFDQEASVSQRFLAIHSTPSNWSDTSRFPNNAW
ncbi:hypothetical protein P389DRAFT_76859 [Cystobasidium minutum MCA 4210]|uniref:uncharacterized protein n=1 Tax=Cystobasidium minutum MCA 4210 TaxID=1397322 RepID=UPI0034CFD8BE|eukprot:jgi/Rhomi1/76859/CE76858_1133